MIDKKGHNREETMTLRHYEILRAVAQTGNFTQAARQLYITQSAVSHQLRLLRNAHLVKTRREGKSIFYSLDDDHVVTIMSQGLAHIRHTGR